MVMSYYRVILLAQCCLVATSQKKLALATMSDDIIYYQEDCWSDGRVRPTDATNECNLSLGSTIPSVSAM